jgi:hypothetical protein
MPWPIELADDAVAPWRGDVLDRGRDVLDVVAGHGRGDTGLEREAGRVDQVGHLGRRLADVERPRAVAMPAIDDRPGVDRDDLSGPDRPLARDPVLDLVIDRDADAGGERAARVQAGIALERRGRSRLADVRLGQAVELGRGHTRLELALDQGQHLGHDPAGPSHALDLGTRLAGHHLRRSWAAGRAWRAWRS